MRTGGVESFSPFCLKAHRALKAAGLPYQRRHGSRPATFAVQPDAPGAGAARRRRAGRRLDRDSATHLRCDRARSRRGRGVAVGGAGGHALNGFSSLRAGPTSATGRRRARLLRQDAVADSRDRAPRLRKHVWQSGGARRLACRRRSLLGASRRCSISSTRARRPSVAAGGAAARSPSPTWRCSPSCTACARR